MPIRPFLSEQAFDPEGIEVTPAAFTAACDASAPYSPRLSQASEYLLYGLYSICHLLPSGRHIAVTCLHLRISNARRGAFAFVRLAPPLTNSITVRS